MLDSVLPVVIALAAFGVLLPLIVFVHEYGHFKVARLCGVRVDTFSIGFGPALTSWRDKKGTVWKIAAIPLGGFVKFFGDANAASAGADAGKEAQPATTQFGSEKDRLEALLTPEEKKVCFHFKPVWQRALVVAAGPFANFVLAVVIFAVLFMSLGQSVVEPRVGRVVEDSAAAEAGFEPGDLILAINGRPVKDFKTLSTRVKLSSDETLTFEVDRNGETLFLDATPRRVLQTDRFGNETRAGQLGIGSASDAVTYRRYGPVGAVGASIDQLGHVISATGRYIGRLVTLKEDPSQMGGPVKIAKYAGQAASSGFDDRIEASVGDRILISLTDFIQLAALVSVSIGLFNLLPVPMLDGGHLLFYAYEAVAGRPLSEPIQAAGFRVGLFLVGSVMVFVIVNDVIQLF